MRSPTMGDTRAFRLNWNCALRRADLKPARRCPWSADAAWDRHRAAGARLRAVTVVECHATVRYERSAEIWTRERLGERHAPRRRVLQTMRRRASA